MLLEPQKNISEPMEKSQKDQSESNLGKTLADYAIESLLEIRGFKLEDISPEVVHCKKISEGIAQLEKERKLQEFSVFSSRLQGTINNKELSKIKELAYLESDKFLTYHTKLDQSKTYNEEIVYNYFINIQIPENLFGFSKEFFISLIITLVLYRLSGRKYESDKQEILKAIDEQGK